MAHADLAKNDYLFFLHKFLLFYVRLLGSINFCFGPDDAGLRVLGCRVDILGTNCNALVLLKCGNLRLNNCSGLKIDWDLPRMPIRHY